MPSGMTLARRAARARERLDGLRETLAGDAPMRVEQILLALVGAMRDEEAASRSMRRLRRAARRRRRRLGVLSFAAGPLAGVASQLVDLCCETAIVCDLAALHRVELTDEQIAAHMLVLWSVAPTVEEAQSAIARRDGRSIEYLLAARMREHVDGLLPEELTPRSAVKALGDVRELGDRLRRRTGATAVGTALFPGRRTRRAIRRAQQQLGVAR